MLRDGKNTRAEQDDLDDRFARAFRRASFEDDESDAERRSDDWRVRGDASAERRKHKLAKERRLRGEAGNAAEGSTAAFALGKSWARRFSSRKSQDEKARSGAAATAADSVNVFAIKRLEASAPAPAPAPAPGASVEEGEAAPSPLPKGTTKGMFSALSMKGKWRGMA